MIDSFFLVKTITLFGKIFSHEHEISIYPFISKIFLRKITDISKKKKKLISSEK